MKKIKINNLVSQKIEKKAMSLLKGGEIQDIDDCCLCGCYGPSSTYQNGTANQAEGLDSYGGAFFCGD